MEGNQQSGALEEMPRIKRQRERCLAEKDSYQIGVWTMETNGAPERCPQTEWTMTKSRQIKEVQD